MSRANLELTQLPMQWRMGVPSQEVKQPEHEADNSPPPPAKGKNVWSYIVIPQYTSMIWCLIK